MTAAARKKHVDVTMLLLQQGIGFNQVHDWYCFNSMNSCSRIALYKFAQALPQQHEQLIAFHLCHVVTQKFAAVSPSSLKVFNLRWPDLVRERIEMFLLPSLIAR